MKELRLIYKCLNCGAVVIKTSPDSSDQKYVNSSFPIEEWRPSGCGHPIIHRCDDHRAEKSDYGFYQYVGFRVVTVKRQTKGKKSR